jgi:hypothetical protein
MKEKGRDGKTFVKTPVGNFSNTDFCDRSLKTVRWKKIE